VANDYYVAFVEKTEDAEDIAANLHPDFIQPIGAGQVLEVWLRNLVKVFYYAQRPQNLFLDSVSLRLIEVAEIVFEKEQAPLFRHATKVAAVVQSDNLPLG